MSDQNGTSHSSSRRIAFCITELEVGGAERCLTEVAVGLAAEGFDVTVYSLAPRPQEPQSLLVDRLEDAKVEVIFLGARRRLTFPWVVARLCRDLRRRNIALLQNFLHHANVLGSVAGCLAGVPHILTNLRVAERRSGWRLWLERAVSRCAERHVCVSQSVADFAAQTGGLKPAKLIVIPNGVDVRRYQEVEPIPNSELGIPSGRRLVTYVGRLDPQKGTDWLVQHAGNWLEEMPAYDLLLVGRGPQQQQLRQMAASSGLADRIHLAGWRRDIPRILKASDLLVLPSRWEGMPGAVLEAMAAGLPVVSTEVEGVRELLGDVADEQVVSRDPHVFFERISGLLRDPERRARLGRANADRAAKNFSLNGMIAAYRDLFERLLAS